MIQKLGCVSSVVILFFFSASPATAWIWGPSSVSECVREYVSNTPDPWAAEMATMMCYRYINTKDKSEKERAECMIEGLQGASSKLGAQIIMSECVDKY